MWKVLLVEDEVFVRTTVRQIINWEELGFTIVGEAGDGLEALDLINDYQPDLVICDIVMPVKNGVDLLREVREAGLDTRFVMLSCMSDFEFVQKAMEFGATNYVLKLSMSVKVMTDILQKVDQDLQQRRNQKLQQISQEVVEFYNSLWKSLFIEPLEPALTPFEESPIQDLSEHHLTIFAVLHGSDSFNRTCFENLHLLEDPKQAILHFFSNSGQTTVFCWSPTALRVLSARPGAYPYPIAYTSVKSFDRLAEAWSAVIQKMDDFWYKRNTGLVYTGINLISENSRNIPWDQMHELLQSFEQNNSVRCLEIIDEMWDSMQENSLTMYMVKEAAIHLDNLFRHIHKRIPREPEDFRNSADHWQLKGLLVESVKDYINKRNWESQQITDHPEIDKVIAYITQTYYKEVTLSTLADYVGMDANYLSNLFKKKTGENIIHYIHRVRIEHAKSYLTQTVLPVNEIGEKVGFVNDNYFIKIFRRFTDQTPSHFRRLHR
jgi:two-component system, response regulator YesN